MQVPCIRVLPFTSHLATWFRQQPSNSHPTFFLSFFQPQEKPPPEVKQNKTRKLEHNCLRCLTKKISFLFQWDVLFNYLLFDSFDASIF